MFEIKVPEFGESIQEVQVASWLKQPGDWVDKDEEIVELESEKASQALVCETAGVLGEIKVAEGEFANVGDVLCVIKEGDKPEGASAPATAQASAGGTAVADPPAAKTADWIMPAAERVLSEYQISADAITPTGPGGRLLKEDVLNYVQKKGLKPGESAPRAAPAPVKSSAPAATKTSGGGVTKSLPDPPSRSKPADEWNNPPIVGTREEKAVPMSMIRRTIAKRLVNAQQTAALLTTFNEIDMLPVKELRAKYKEPFLKKHGVKLGFMSFFAKAAVEGLKRFPAINSEIRGDQVVMKNFHDIGIAIGGGKGLVVPVLRNVERMSFADVERQIGEYAALAQANKIVPDDMKDGTFTISNGGVYGSLLSTPIVNPPQSGILGLHTIQDRPIAENGQVVIRPMMYIALTYDHRIVDGREAVGFLKTIKEVLEEPARLFLEV
ncbi:MAG: 2-oxoglutarate dehydrogenase complex dihydrolipoyllysine-residue succinyltransferase [Mariniblastus sp.]